MKKKPAKKIMMTKKMDKKMDKKMASKKKPY
jgi:hypothetical protein